MGGRVSVIRKFYRAVLLVCLLCAAAEIFGTEEPGE